MLKLNLGCGKNHLPTEEGWVNIDKFPPADNIIDMEVIPWAYTSDSVDEVRMTHVLEHLGQKSEDFLKLIQEVYRVCRHGAHWVVTVPHPRHDHFIIDPTHCRAIMPEFFPMLSKKVNQEWIDGGFSSTPLAMQYDVNFEIERCEVIGDKRCKARIARELEEMFGDEMTPVSIDALTVARMRVLEKQELNVIQEFTVTLRVVK